MTCDTSPTGAAGTEAWLRVKRQSGHTGSADPMEQLQEALHGAVFLADRLGLGEAP